MYEDNEKRKKIYVESNCVSRDDCCWDETPEMQAATRSMAGALDQATIMWPYTETEQDWLSKK